MTLQTSCSFISSLSDVQYKRRQQSQLCVIFVSSRSTKNPKTWLVVCLVFFHKNKASISGTLMTVFILENIKWYNWVWICFCIYTGFSPLFLIIYQTVYDNRSCFYLSKCFGLGRLLQIHICLQGQHNKTIFFTTAAVCQKALTACKNWSTVKWDKKGGAARPSGCMESYKSDIGRKKWTFFFCCC